MPRNSRLAAENKARAALKAAIAEYCGDPTTDRAAEASVLLALHKLAAAIEPMRRRNDREAMRTAHGFARLAAIHPRLVELLVEACERQTSPFARIIADTRPAAQALLEAQNPGISCDEAFIWIEEQWGRHPGYGPQRALAMFVGVLKARGPCRPTDLERVAALVLSDTRIRRLQKGR
jgi:hypothetical protein